MESVKERFLRYIAIHTESAEADTVPSTSRQHDLASLLTNELKEIGASNIRYDKEHCYVYATIPATSDAKVPVLGFIAHMDTSPAISGENVKARCVPDYDGNDIILNDELNIVLSPSVSKFLATSIGIGSIASFSSRTTADSSEPEVVAAMT